MKTSATLVFWLRSALGVLALLLARPTMAQMPTWQHTLDITQGSTSSSRVLASTTDANGNVYVAGTFTNQIVFGLSTFVSAGGQDGFVAKYTPDGRNVWGKRLGGADNEQVTGIAVENGRVCVSGTFDGRTVVLANTSYPGVGSVGTDIFVAAFFDNSPYSNVLLVQVLGSASYDYAPGLVMHGSSVYLAGSFAGASLPIGPTVLPNTTGNQGGLSDVFVAKFDLGLNTLTPQWAVAAGGQGFEQATALAVSGSSVYVAGQFTGPPATFGPTVLTATNMSYDGFVAKLTDAGTTGSFVWAERFGSGDNDQGTALAVAGSSVYVGGQLGVQPGTFGPFTVSGSSSSIPDAFVAKLTDAGPLGAFDWVQPLGSADGYEELTALTVQGGHIYAAGTYLRQSTAFGSTTLPNTTASTTDGYVVSLADGPTAPTVEWAQPIGGTGFEYVNTLLVLGNQLFVGGSSTSPSITIGTYSITNPAVNGASYVAVLDGILLGTADAAASRAGFSLWPNPAVGTTTLRWAAPAGPGPVSLRLTDALGRAVRTATVPAATLVAGYSLGLAGLPPGLYLLRLTSGSTQLTRRLVVE